MTGWGARVMVCDGVSTRARLVLGTRIGGPSSGKFFPAMMTWDEEENPLRPGDHAVVTFTIGDAEAPS